MARFGGAVRRVPRPLGFRYSGHMGLAPLFVLDDHHTIEPVLHVWAADHDACFVPLHGRPRNGFAGSLDVVIRSSAVFADGSVVVSRIVQQLVPDRVELIFTKFINLVSCKPVVQTLLPLDPQDIADPEDEIFRLTTKDGLLTVEPGAGPANTEPKIPSDIVFEQTPEQLLNALLPLYLQNQMLRSLQESAASELASRMTAMNNASDNAKELAKSLTLDYNKARQAAITQEILEVAGGAAAVG